jgi:hypothetical protein
MRNINHFIVPHQAHFTWSMKNVFGLNEIFSRPKHLKAENSFT